MKSLDRRKLLTYLDTNSAQPCGCDDGIGWLCKWHQMLNGIPEATLTEASPISEDVSVATVKPSGQIGIGGAPTRATTLPSDPTLRKTFPVASGVLDYFPDALVAVSHVSWQGNEQHNPGQPLHWARGKSADEADTMMRHFLQRGSLDSDGMRHSAKMVWRALALLQKEIEDESK